MRYRGSDDDVINFGHFCEVRKVKEGPTDVLPSPRPGSSLSDEKLDEYAAQELTKKSSVYLKKHRCDNRAIT